MTQKKIIVSGMRPTGYLHLGHYFGVLKNWLELQKNYQCYFFAADWHSLTTEYANPEQIQQFVRSMFIDWLSVGIDPTQSTLFIQSQVPEHAQLHLLLSMMTPVSWLERVPSYKDLKQELSNKDLSTYGFLGYPLLQTADIILYKANLVPVGEDQVAHIELSREVVRRFNFLYKKEVFPEPQPLLTKASKVMGTDGRKMSKSYNNAIFISDSEDEVNKKLKLCMTDPQRQRRTDPGNPDVCPIYYLHQEVSEKSKVEEVNAQCRSAGIGCVDCKKLLLGSLNSVFAPIREKRKEWEQNPKKIDEVIQASARKCRQVAAATLDEVNEVMGVNFNAN